MVVVVPEFAAPANVNARQRNKIAIPPLSFPLLARDDHLESAGNTADYSEGRGSGRGGSIRTAPRKFRRGYEANRVFAFVQIPTVTFVFPYDIDGKPRRCLYPPPNGAKHRSLFTTYENRNGKCRRGEEENLRIYGTSRINNNPRNEVMCLVSSCPRRVVSSRTK